MRAAAVMVKSNGDPTTQSRNDRQTSSACCLSSPWNTIETARLLFGRSATLSPQWGLHRLVA